VPRALPDVLTIDGNAGQNPDQRADNDVARIVDAEVHPCGCRKRGKPAEQKDPTPPRISARGWRRSQQIGRVVARKAAPVLEVGVPFESRRIGADRVHRAIAIGQ